MSIRIKVYDEYGRRMGRGLEDTTLKYLPEPGDKIYTVSGGCSFQFRVKRIIHRTHFEDGTLLVTMVVEDIVGSTSTKDYGESHG